MLDADSNPDTVLLDIDNRGVARLTLNRPEKHNAFDSQLISLLQDSLDAVKDDADVRVVVLAAMGDNFSSGADLNWMKNASEFSLKENIADATALAQVLYTLNTLPFPTIAVAQGFSCGGAMGLLSCCDFVLSCPLAKFVFSEVKLGLIPAVISPYVIAAIGERNARRYFLSAERFNSHEAHRIGLVSEIVDRDQLPVALDKTIALFLLNSPAAMSEAKALISHVYDHPINADLIRKTSEWIAQVRTSEEGQEGLRAFMEKRAPAWAELSEKGKS